MPAQRVRACVRLRLTHSQQRDGALTPPRLRQAAARSLDGANARSRTRSPAGSRCFTGSSTPKIPERSGEKPQSELNRTHSSEQREEMESKVSYQEPQRQQQQQKKSLRMTPHHWRSGRSSGRRSRLLLCGNSPTVRDKNPERGGRGWGGWRPIRGEGPIVTGSETATG